MLIQAVYDFTLRDQDSDKTLSFDKGDVFIFIEVYPKDENWLKAADRNGRIGYIPKNYVEISLRSGKNDCLDFMKEAIYHAKQNNLSTAEELHRIRDNLSWLEYREILARELRNTMSSVKVEKSQTTIKQEKGQDNDREESTDYDETESNKRNNEQKSKCGSSRSFNKAKNDFSSSSVYSVPAESIRSVPMRRTKSRQDDEGSIILGKDIACRQSKARTSYSKTVSGRPSTSCSIDRRAGPQDTYDSEETRQNQLDEKYAVKTNRPNDEVSTYLSGWDSYSKTSRKSYPPTRLRGNAEYNCELDPHVLSLFKIVQDAGVDAKRSEFIVHRVLHHISTQFQPDMPGKVQTVLKVLQRSSSMSSLHESPRVPSEESALRYLASLGEHCRYEDRERVTDDSLVLSQIDTLKAEIMSLDSKEADHFLRSDDFRSLLGIVSLYSYEPQRSIKDRILDLLSFIGSASRGARSILLSSMLPVSIVQELYESVEDPGKLSRLAKPLIALMASSEPLPHSHRDIMGKKFISFLLNYIEEPMTKDNEEEEKAKRDLLNTIIAYNLQFKPEEENPVIRAIAGREPAVHYFIDAVLFLFEREVDPLPSADDRNLDSVLKLMKDMFSSRRSAEHFHTAHMKALTDSLISRVSDLRPGNPRRAEYIQLVRLVLKNRDFNYRLSDVGYAFMVILLEDDPLSSGDQKVIRSICKEFPGIVTKGSIPVATGGKG